jgi:hypothetical protein
METASFTLSECPQCRATSSPGARFCRSCGGQLVPAALQDGTRRAGDQARGVGKEVSERVAAAWAAPAMRLPLIATGVALAGAFLPWMTAGGKNVAISNFSATWPVVVAVVIAVVLVAYASISEPQEWLLLAAVGAAFFVAVLAVMSFALLWVGTHIASGMLDALDIDKTHVGVGVGAYVVTAGSVAVFLGTGRLLGRMTRDGRP